MAMRSYGAIISRHGDEPGWSIVFPDFPEIASAAESVDSVDREAFDALATAVDLYTEGRKPLPDPRGIGALHRDLPADAAEAFISFIPIEAPAPLRVNISMDQALLTRIDTAADRQGMTRSAFLAESARRRLEELKSARDR